MSPAEKVGEEGVGCTPYQFHDLEEVEKLISTAWENVGKGRAEEKLVERWKVILDEYQEQPHLLDPQLPKLLGRLLTMIRTHETKEQLSITSVLLYHLIKVRGHKNVTRYFPHEVEDLVFVLDLLETLDLSYTWEIKCILILWLSIIVIIPFQMSRFDSGEKEPTASRILNICKVYLTAFDKSRDAASYLASKFLSRPDTKDTQLPDFIQWALDLCTKEGASGNDITGGLMSLSAVFKHTKREELLPYASKILTTILGCNFKHHINTYVRKCNLKLIQRIGLVFLKVKVASWRYQRGSRVLTIKLQGDQAEDTKSENGTKDGENAEDEEYDVPEEIEDIIESLLNGLKDPDTFVRWMAAKGIGRVTGRLASCLADEVVSSLLELFSDRETDSTWHGCCLAVAELGRRGLLLPDRLPQVTELLSKALVYDERRGSCSVGAHIRDAACYVCWAFSRAYDPEVLKPHIHSMATMLLVVTSFDREVHCRRAASAAFQEMVGRQGTFPHGIDILTTADYFSVGQRSNAYLSISDYIAQFSSYNTPLVMHLIDKKLGHWDPAVRELAVKALGRLTHRDVNLILEKLPKILETCLSIDLFYSHGATLAVGQIVRSLSTIAKEKETTLQSIVGANLLSMIEHLVDNLMKGNKLRGLGGELMRGAVSEFIQDCSIAALPISKQVLDTWRSVLLENLADVEERIQIPTVSALAHFTAQYYIKEGKLVTFQRDEFLAQAFKMLKEHEDTRKGVALALGSLQPEFVKGKEEEIIENLIRCSRISEGTESWGESRRDAVKAIAEMCKKVHPRLSDETVHTVYDSFMLSLDDYTVDKRGDIGAWVREAALHGLETLTLTLLAESPNRLPVSVMQQMMPLVVQQANEKIDRVRAQAGRIFYTLLYAKSPTGDPIPGVIDRDQLMKIFTQEHAGIKWGIESETFPLFVQLVQIPGYSEKVLLGLIVSVGGLTERLVKNSSQSLFALLETMDKDGIDTLCAIILKIFSEYQKVDRVSVPLLKFLDLVITSGFLEPLFEDPDSKFPMDLLNLCKNEINKSGDPNKLMASADIFCQLLQCENELCRRKCLVQLAIFLCHRFPRVRKHAADKLYESVLTFADKTVFPEETGDEAMSLLGETNWMNSTVEQLKPVRNQFCQLVNIPVPQIIKKPV